MSVPLNYQSPACAKNDLGLRYARRRRLAIWITTPTATLLLLWLVLTIPVGTSNWTVDAVTGTIRHTRSYPFGLGSSYYTVSSLETRLTDMHYQWTPRWQGGSAHSLNVFGQRVRRLGCGSTPATYQVRFIGDFIANASDDEIRAFVHVMETGTDEEQRDAVFNVVAQGNYQTTSNSVASR